MFQWGKCIVNVQNIYIYIVSENKSYIQINHRFLKNVGTEGEGFLSDTVSFIYL